MREIQKTCPGLFAAVVTVFLTGQSWQTWAQRSDAALEAQRIPRISSKEVMERPVGLTPAPGRMHQKVSTSSAEAQAYYDQGVAYLHSYVWVEAARSFHEALRRDRELAMAYLGLAKAYFNAEAIADALSYFKKAAEVAAQGKVTPKEAKWIALGRLQMDAVFAAAEERTKKHDEYKKAIDDLIAMDPDDAHAWVLRGNAEESSPSGRGQGGRVGSIAYYDAALKRDPNHWGADHYLIHSYEGLGLYQKAAEHGSKYAAAVSGVPHAQHMYAHVLPRLGKWEDAVTQLEKADQLQRDYFAQGVAPVEEWHHGHNIHLLGAVHLRLGHEKEAEQYLREAFNLEVRSLRDGRFTDPWLEFLLLRGRYDEALTSAQQAEQRPLALARFIGSIRAAEALMALGRMDEARKAQERAQANLATFQKEIAIHPLYDRLGRSYDDTLLKPLEAQFALFGSNPQEGDEPLVKLADRFANEKGFDGWVTGIFRLQQLAGVAQRAGRTKLAGELLERVRRIDPHYFSKIQAMPAGRSVPLKYLPGPEVFRGRPGLK